LPPPNWPYAASWPNCPTADRARALHEIERALDAFVDQEGVALSVEIIIGVGTK
jgi:hypothetical protein